MKPVTAGLLHDIDRYVEQLFVPADAVLEQNLQAAFAAGLPPIHVSPTEGRLLYLLARMSGARRVLEVGTLGAYSTTWLARAVGAGGTVVTLERDPRHAEVARRNLEGVAPGVQIEVRLGDAAESLRALAAAREAPFDLVFIDADKPGYVGYLDLVLSLSRPGTVILADNVIRHGAVLGRAIGDANAVGARAFNEAIAAHPRLESTIVPIIRESVDGLSISIVR